MKAIKMKVSSYPFLPRSGLESEDCVFDKLLLWLASGLAPNSFRMTYTVPHFRVHIKSFRITNSTVRLYYNGLYETTCMTPCAKQLEMVNFKFQQCSN